MQDFDLTELLEVGDTIYDAVFNRRVVVRDINPTDELPILVVGECGKNKRRFSKCGSLISFGKDCYLFPSKENHDWTGYQSPVKVNQYDFVLVSDDENQPFQLGLFSHRDEQGLFHIYSTIDLNDLTKPVETKGYIYLKDVPFEHQKFFCTRLGNRGFKKSTIDRIRRSRENKTTEE